MPFRPITTNTSLCIVCSASTTRTCRNCSGLHCATHMVGTSCPGCSSELWAIERRYVGPVISVMTAVGVLGAGVLFTLMPGVELGLIAMASFCFGAPLVTKGTGLLVRSRLAKRRFLPSSKPMLLPAAGATSVALADRGPESEYSIRRRRNRMVVKPRAPRAVFMTRGGYFYQ